MQCLGPLVFGSDGNIVQFLSDKCLLEDRFTFVLFVCLFVFISVNVNLGGWTLQLGKNPLVKNTPPIPLNVSWGAYSSVFF